MSLSGWQLPGSAQEANQLSQASSTSPAKLWALITDHELVVTEAASLSACLADKRLEYSCSGARLFHSIKVPGVCWAALWVSDYSFSYPQRLCLERWITSMFQRERVLPLTSFVFHKCFPVYTSNLMAFKPYILFLSLSTAGSVAIEDGTCAWEGPGSGEWDIPVGSFLGPCPFFMELRQEYKWRPWPGACCSSPSSPWFWVYCEGPHTPVNQPANPNSVYFLPGIASVWLLLHMLAARSFSRKMD